ncbi:MAG: electron transfer flavoprotein subunit beta/FixA family protein [Chloroflexi bacterium]|nr:electron transfer flavoprotein subunit beta/FixA family protein [Chloroflexota bacterium]
MKILICLKQVPDSTVRVKVAPGGKDIVTEGMTWAISPYDEYAIELALEVKDGDPTTTVSVVSVGPARARDALRQALAMGCDDASLVVGEASGLGLSRALAKVVMEAKPDVVLCGKQASDDDQGFIGPALAEALSWPHVPFVTKLAGASGAVEAWRETEGGHEVWKASAPVVLTVQKSAKEPRYPSLPGIMKAKKKEIPEREIVSLNVDTSGQTLEIASLEPPPVRGGGKMLKDGDMAAIAADLVRLLREEAKVL